MPEIPVVLIETIGWISTIAFLASIIIPNRLSLHKLGVFTSVTTGFYSFAHGATAIWVKWVIAFFFHVFMIWKLSRNLEGNTRSESGVEKKDIVR